MLLIGMYLFLSVGVIACLISGLLLWAGWFDMARDEKVSCLILFFLGLAVVITLATKLMPITAKLIWNF